MGTPSRSSIFFKGENKKVLVTFCFGSQGSENIPKWGLLMMIVFVPEVADSLKVDFH